MNLKSFTRHTALTLLMTLATGGVSANEAVLDHSPLPEDNAALVRGAEIVATNCNGCHGLKYLRYRHLLNLGVNKDKIEAWRGSQSMDATLAPQMSEEAAKESFGGAVPPDLSLMASAREGGGHYLYSYLTGYHNTQDGALSNTIFPETRMPDVLGIATATDEKQKADIQAQAKDVSAFLIWAADPHAPERKQLGIYVLIYLAFMTTLLYLWKRRIWARIDQEPPIE